MLEIPASNGGEYREYLVSHETLQERPRLRLPVCGETAVPSLFQPTPARVLFISPLSLSFSLLLFRSPFINYNKPGINRWKILLSRNPPPLHLFILFPFNLPMSHREPPIRYLEYRCLSPGNRGPMCWVLGLVSSINLEEKNNKLEVVIVV